MESLRKIDNVQHWTQSPCHSPVVGVSTTLKDRLSVSTTCFLCKPFDFAVPLQGFCPEEILVHMDMGVHYGIACNILFLKREGKGLAGQLQKGSKPQAGDRR